MRFALTAFVAAVLLSSTAQAAMEVLGDGPARLCFLAANGEGYAGMAAEMCSKALRTDLTPQDRAATFVNRGVIELLARDYDAAMGDFDESIRIKPGMGEGYLNRGATLIALNRFREALADIDKGLALGISKPQIGYYDRAIANEGLGNARAAYDDYRQALSLAPDFVKASDQLKRFKVLEKPDGT